MQRALPCVCFKLLIAFKTSRLAQAVLTADAVDAAGDAEE
jgi:hypothetical protein